LPSGTLGKIASSSAKNPRTLIQLTASESDVPAQSVDIDRKYNMFITHSIPFLIEEGIKCLMNIEDLDGMISSSPDNPA
jgi:type II secretory pathway component PulL